MLLISLFALRLPQSSTLGVTSFQSHKQATGNGPTIYPPTKWESNKDLVEMWTADHFVNHRSSACFFPQKEKQSMRIWMLFFFVYC